MSCLCSLVKCWRDYGRVIFVQVVVESARVTGRVDMVGGVNHDPAFVLLYQKADRGDEDFVEKAPDPTGENQDEVIVVIVNNFLQDVGVVGGDAVVIVIEVPMGNIC